MNSNQNGDTQNNRRTKPTECLRKFDNNYLLSEQYDQSNNSALKIP